MSKHTIKFLDWHTTDYGKSWEWQQEIFNKQIERKNNHQPTEHYLIFVEHPHVYTLGKNGNQDNLLISEAFLKQINASYYKVDRGGDITYHGPGQIVGYPIFDLEAFRIGYKEYIENLENAIIQYLKDKHNIEAFQMKGATGVWVNSPCGEEKICAIGTRASKFITMHGFAFNVNTNLDYFGYINPCGFVDKGVTSLQKIYRHPLDFEQEKIFLRDYIARAFNAELIY